MIKYQLIILHLKIYTETKVYYLRYMIEHNKTITHNNMLNLRNKLHFLG